MRRTHSVGYLRLAGPVGAGAWGPIGEKRPEELKLTLPHVHLHLGLLLVHVARTMLTASLLVAGAARRRRLFCSVVGRARPAADEGRRERGVGGGSGVTWTAATRAALRAFGLLAFTGFSVEYVHLAAWHAA